MEDGQRNAPAIDLGNIPSWIINNLSKLKDIRSLTTFMNLLPYLVFCPLLASNINLIWNEPIKFFLILMSFLIICVLLVVGAGICKAKFKI
jgi:hypothetical protein